MIKIKEYREMLGTTFTKTTVEKYFLGILYYKEERQVKVLST